MSNLELAKKELKFVHIMPLSANQVMKKAWQIAKEIAAEFSVSSKALLSLALKRVWANVKVKVSLFNAYESRKNLAFLGWVFNAVNKAWECEMKLAEFTKPQPVRFGRGWKTESEILRSYNHKHQIKFI